jgi:MSHA biogenesis protein MshP
VAVIVVLVLLAVLAAAIVRLASSEQAGVAQSLSAARANQAAGAGLEWGLYQALVTGGSWTSCSGATHTIDLSADAGTTGMWVTVTCSSKAYNEGLDSSGNPQLLRLFTIDAVACNSSAGCPDAARATSPTYVERHRQVQATNLATP